MTCPDCGHIFEPPEQETKVQDVYQGSVLSTIDEFKIVDVTYAPWNMQKEGKTPTLRVTYHCQTGEKVSEWICPQHPEGSFPYRKAMKWWFDRGGTDFRVNTPHNEVIKSIIEFGWCNDLLVPETLKCSKNGKFWEVKAYGRLVEKVSYSAPPVYSASICEEDIPW